MLPRVPSALTFCPGLKELRWGTTGKKEMNSKTQVSCGAERADQMFIVGSGECLE